MSMTEIFSIDFDPGTVGIGFTLVPISSPATTIMSGVATNTPITPQARSSTITTTATITTTSSVIASSSSSTSSAVASPTTAAATHHSGPSTGQTIGIIVGVVAAATLIICLIFYFCWKQKRRSARQVSYSQKYLAQKRTSLLSRQSFQIQAHRPSQNPARSNQQVRWPDNVGTAGVAGNVGPTERRRSSNPSRNTEMRSRSVMRISEPIPEERPEVLPSFEDRFFSTPSPLYPTDSNNQKHASDATTIRTSGNPPTPNRPAISLLRLQSTRTSKGTTFEEDRDSSQDQVPPLPTFTAIQIPLPPIATTSDQNRPTRLTLEAGIKRSISKAMSHMPAVHTNEGANVSQLKRPRFSRSKESLQPVPRINGTPDSGEPGPSLRSRLSSTHTSPRSPYPEIPERSSSRHGSRNHSDEEPLLGERDASESQLRDTNILQPPPLTIKKSNELSIRNLAYPQIPSSASEMYDRNVSSSLQAPFDPWSQLHTGRAEDIEKYSIKPLPPVAKAQDSSMEPVRTSHIVRQFKLPSRLYIPPTAQNASQAYLRSDLFSPEATLTPNRTNTGDLVLTVDM